MLTRYAKHDNLQKTDRLDSQEGIMKDNSPSQHVSTDRYKAILQTAESLFAERGYENVSTEEIARTAGVSKGLIGYHFKNKEELFIKVIESCSALISSQLTSIRDSGDSARSKMHAAVKAYLDISCARPALSKMATIAFFETPNTEKLRSLWLAYLDENQNFFSSLVEEGIANEEVEPIDSHLVTRFVVGMALEMLRLTAFQQRPLDTNKTADEIIHVVFDGIARKSV